MTDMNRRRVALSVLTLAWCCVAAWYPRTAHAIDGDNGRLKYGLEWFYLSGGNETSVDALMNDWETNPVPLAAYDPSKPTIIYFHGWQPASGGNKEGFNWDPPGSVNEPPIQTLTEWKNNGWNVGIFFWNQFADEGTIWELAGVYVSQAEAKIWSSQGPKGLRYKYWINGTHHYSPNQPDPWTLNLPVINGGRWGNNLSDSEIGAAVRFIYGVDPNTPEGINLAVALHGVWINHNTSCEGFVEDVACTQIGGQRNLCSGQRPEWKEAYLSKICAPLPSIGDIAVYTLYKALEDQSNSTLWFAGHSLGHQLATRTAMHLHLAHAHNNAASFERYLPERVELLDPYATSANRSYLNRPYTAATGNMGNGSPGSTASRVLEYQRRLKEMSPEVRGTYYLTSSLARTPGSTNNHTLMNEIPTQRIYFDYVSTWSQPDRHVFAPKWYFATKAHGVLTTNSNRFNPPHWLPLGMSAETVNGYLGMLQDVDAHLAQQGGRNTFTPTDDTFFLCGKDDNRWNNHDYSCGVVAAPPPDPDPGPGCSSCHGASETLDDAVSGPGFEQQHGFPVSAAPIVGQTGGCHVSTRSTTRSGAMLAGLLCAVGLLWRRRR